MRRMFTQVNIPAPVGMICAGLFLENVPNSGPNQAILIWGLKAIVVYGDSCSGFGDHFPPLWARD